MSSSNRYRHLLDDEIFMRGDVKGRLGTVISILTDMMIDLNALQIYYEKPSSKSVSPAVIGELREKLIEAKEILHGAMAHKE